MAKRQHQYLCRACGGVQVRWMGKCPDCNAWDSLEEYKLPAATKSAGRTTSGTSIVEAAEAPRALKISEIDEDSRVASGRLPTGIAELDRVLGGGVSELTTSSKAKPSTAGFVAGSVIMLGGDPGVGKSTLMLQAADRLAAQGASVLYVTSEESAHQLRLRSQRLGVKTDSDRPLYVLADTNLSRILHQAGDVQPRVLIADSIQMMYHGEIPSAPGSVAQLRACAQELVVFAKTTGCIVILIGHVTKQGQLAGPKLLEHMVDTVLYFEGDRYHSHRIIRAIKNRFGTTMEVGLFEMGDKGLHEVADGSSLLAAEYQAHPGSVVCPVLQGTRCLLVEVQALTATGFLGSVKRKASGLDSNRLAMLIAVLEKHAGLRLADQDIFVSAVGGMKIAEPAVDLPLALAIASTHMNRTLVRGSDDANIMAVGEIGLGGELRHVQQMELRLREAARLGFRYIITPPTNVKPPKGCELIPVKRLQEAIAILG